MVRIHGWGSCGREFESHYPEIILTTVIRSLYSQSTLYLYVIYTLMLPSLLNQKSSLIEKVKEYIKENESKSLYTIFSNNEIWQIWGFRVDRLSQETESLLCDMSWRNETWYPEIVLITMTDVWITEPHIHLFWSSLFTILSQSDHWEIPIFPKSWANYIEWQLLYDNTKKKRFSYMTRKSITPLFNSIIAPNTPHCFENKPWNSTYYALWITYPRINWNDDFHIISKDNYTIR